MPLVAKDSQRESAAWVARCQVRASFVIPEQYHADATVPQAKLFGDPQYSILTDLYYAPDHLLSPKA